MYYIKLDLDYIPINLAINLSVNERFYINVRKFLDSEDVLFSLENGVVTAMSMNKKYYCFDQNGFIKNHLYRKVNKTNYYVKVYE